MYRDQTEMGDLIYRCVECLQWVMHHPWSPEGAEKETEHAIRMHLPGSSNATRLPCQRSFLRVARFPSWAYGVTAATEPSLCLCFCYKCHTSRTRITICGTASQTRWRAQCPACSWTRLPP